MNETLNSVPTEVKLITDAPAGQVLTSNGDGTSSWQAPASGSGTFGRVTLPNAFATVTMNVNRGIITIPGLTANTSGVPALFSVNNTNVTTDSVVLVSVKALTYTTGVLSVSVSQIENGWFSVFVSVVKGSISNVDVDVHFTVL